MQSLSVTDTITITHCQNVCHRRNHSQWQTQSLSVSQNHHNRGNHCHSHCKNHNDRRNHSQWQTQSLSVTVRITFTENMSVVLTVRGCSTPNNRSNLPQCKGSCHTWRSVGFFWGHIRCHETWFALSWQHMAHRKLLKAWVNDRKGQRQYNSVRRSSLDMRVTVLLFLKTLTLGIVHYREARSSSVFSVHYCIIHVSLVGWQPSSTAIPAYMG